MWTVCTRADVFFSVVNIVSVNGTKRHTGVSELMSAFGRVNWDILRRILDTLQFRRPVRAAFERELEFVEEFCNRDFRGHVQLHDVIDMETFSTACVSDANCHDTLHCAVRAVDGTQTNPSKLSCNSCCRVLALPMLLYEMAKAEGVERGILQRLEEYRLPKSEESTIKLLSHMVRSQSQRTHCVDVLLSSLADSDTAYLVVDYKMKFLPLMHSQGQEFHFAQEGSSVHGAAIIALRPGATRDMLNTVSGRGFSNISTLPCKTELLHVHYFLQIVAFKASKDAEMTMAVIEDALNFISTSPHYRGIRKVESQSDSAKTYTECALPLTQPFLTMSTGLQVISFEHNERHDGKTLLESLWPAGALRRHRQCNGQNSAQSYRPIFPSHSIVQLDLSVRLII